MVRIGLIMLVGSCVLIWFGGQDIYTAISNWNPDSITCEQYLAQRPDDEWLELTDCAMNLDDMAIESSGSASNIVRIYVPLRPTTVAPDADGSFPRSGLVLVSEDEELLELVSQQEAGNPDALLTLDTRYGMSPRTYRGLVQWGHNLDDNARSQVASIAGGSVTSDFALMSDGEEPSFFWGVVKLGGGLLMLAFLGLALLGRESGGEA